MTGQARKKKEEGDDERRRLAPASTRFSARGEREKGALTRGSHHELVEDVGDGGGATAAAEIPRRGCGGGRRVHGRRGRFAAAPSDSSGVEVEAS